MDIDITNADQQTEFLRLAQRLYRLRRERDNIFNNPIFADPAWDLLLGLYVRTGEGQRVDVATACKASLNSEQTTVRYLNALIEQGYISVLLPSAGQSSLTLTQLGNSLMTMWLARVRQPEPSSENFEVVNSI